MKKDLHPANYRPVAFKDMSNGDVFISRSTANTRETIEIDGVEYPLVKLDISNTSHPFYTGKQTLVDTAGRVETHAKQTKVIYTWSRKYKRIPERISSFSFLLPRLNQN